MLRSLGIQLLDGLTVFLSWWGAELAALVPLRWKEKLFPPDDRAILTVGQDVIVLARPRAGEEELVLWQQPAMPPGVVEISDLTQAVADKPVHIRFERELGLSRRIVMPAMSRGDLGNAVIFQVEQLFPFRAEDVYVAHGVLEIADMPGQADVSVAVIERPLVDGWLQTLRGAGLRAASYAVASERGLLSFHRQPAPVDHRGRNARAGLAGLTAVLFVGLLFAWHAHREAYVEFLELGIKERRAVAMQSRKLSGRIDAAVATRAWLTGEVGKPDLGAVIEGLSRHLPDTAWAEQLEWRGKQLHLQGFAADPVALPKQAAAGGLLENVQFRATASNRGQDGKERFDLTADVKGIP